MEIQSAKIVDLFQAMKRELMDLYPREELKPIIEIILSHVTGLSRIQLRLEREKELSESQVHFIQSAVARLKKYEPVQYITGTASFHGYEFKVNPSVLIPRPETEGLVDWVAKEHESSGGLSLLDVGTGSGCIAITLKKKMPDNEVTAIDNSAEAIETAKDNDASLEAGVNILNLDILDKGERSKLPVFDVIVSNPPYVTAEDRKKMLRNVTDHEPGQALYVDDPLFFYNEIISFAGDHLSKGGKVYFETNERYAGEVKKLLDENGFEKTEVRRDMQGKERMVKGVKG